MNNSQEEKTGRQKSSDDILISTAANAVLGVPGVSELASGLTGMISENLLGIDSSGRGIKISRNDEGIIFDVYVIVEYKTKIPQLAWELQSVLKEKAEAVTDSEILEINIHVQGVNLPERKKNINDKN